ncbi:MAG: transcriptional regulator [Bacteroidales bacterium 45-6]|nr:MAG: transcriptional regulator [Bacteroidales bacterium 45-6]
MIDIENEKRLYFSIKEVAEHFQVNESLLRFWEKEFSVINPRKTSGGTRQYSKTDIESIAVVYHLLKEQGLTIDGAKQKLKTKKDEYQTKSAILAKLEAVRKELNDLMNEL